MKNAVSAHGQAVSLSPPHKFGSHYSGTTAGPVCVHLGTECTLSKIV
jgi:hypothetical protein